MGAASAMNPAANAGGQPELSERKAAVLNDARRTIAVTAPRRSRFSRLRVVYPDHAPQPAYDVALARELLGRTGEIPHSKRGLVVVLTEYRHALHALAQQLELRERYDRHQRVLAAGGRSVGDGATPTDRQAES